jgi:hypothetical protein
LLRNLVGKRIAKIDRARVELFDLEPSEIPVEAQAVMTIGAWPAPPGMLMDPVAAAESPAMLPDWVAGIPFSCVLLVTSTHLRWCPHRSYRGRSVFQPPLDVILGGRAPLSKEIYGTFDSRILGPRGVPVSTIKRVALDSFSPTELALVTVHLTESTNGIAGGHPWPVYEMAAFQATVSRPLPPWHHADDQPDSPYLQFMARGPAAAYFALFMSKAFEYLVIPFQTEHLSASEAAAWSEWSQLDPGEWRLLNQRLGG